ncbi:glycosyltransferase [Aliiroseovarius sp. Z3]|uniref:glycosyltransferase n=1 Tax=Aliiroseovarius sp. Z3 TaxID=2811402 RepID=UPI0023B22F68|nr:glycosyltransferase [Aliiroseovarius sp. Z3]MDE9449954.1 glycosyltransferase [Aliiroseovarius sp. Z3]
MTQAWLSVIMPVFNGGTTLGAALSSLVGQCDGLEIIAIDQGSTDGSRQILEEAQDRLPIRIIDNPDGSSWTENTNIGLREAHAPLITMLHQDDIWLPGRAALLRDISTQHQEVDIWVHGADLIDAQGKTVGQMCPPFGNVQCVVSSEEALSHLIVQNTLALPAVMFRRNAALRKGGLDEELWYTADWDLWLNLAQNGLAWDPTRASAFRIHGTSLTITGSRDLQSFKRQLEIPLDRHLAHLPDRLATRARKRAEAANALNVCLAGLHHRNLRGVASALRAFFLLGPFEWRDFFTSTQIVNRLVPRLKLGLKRGI